MNRNSFLLKFTALISLFTLMGCPTPTVRPRPIASFEYEPVVGKSGQIQFKNTSQHGQSYQWDFGDGQASTEENPLVQYRANGNFTVSLVAKNDVGQDQARNSIIVSGVATSGSVMFYTDGPSDGDIQVFVDNALRGSVTKFSTSQPNNCGQDGFVTFFADNGTYPFYAQSKSKSWSGVIEVKIGQCAFKLLPK